MQLMLKIVPSERSERKLAAWFLPGNDVQAWIAQIASWNVPLVSVTLRPIPRSLLDRHPIGVLVTTAGADDSLLDIRQSGSLAIPYSLIAGRLYVPVAAALTPAVTNAELMELLPRDGSDFVWHPSVGLVRFEKEERLRISDLIEPCPTLPSRWDRAVPGITYRSRLLSVEPAATLTVEQIMISSADGIGSSGGSLDELPPSPGEGFAGKIHEWTKPFRNAWKSLWKFPNNKTQTPPTAPNASNSGQGMAGGRNPLMGFLGMAFVPLAGIAAAADAALRKILPQSTIDQTARLREVDRLLDLLKDDPDAGLKFALPMGGADAPRGITNSGNQLLPHDTNFGLGKLFGSHPVDPWDVPQQQQHQLILKYRELAVREIRLGRHRRAAYIYAELLNDLPSAATTLEAGLHYREAAVLYRDRLNRPQEAARCLERGGLLDEAAEMYVELRMLENAADLYFRLQRPEEAERLLREWSAKLLRDGEYLRASEIHHQKLHDVDQALAILDEGWKRRLAISEACLKQEFSLLSQYARHESAAGRVAELQRTGRDELFCSAVTRILTGVARDYPDSSVRHEAGEATRVVVAGRLRVASRSEQTQLLQCISSLAPQDRLLARDCERFVSSREKTPSPVRPKRVEPKTEEIKPLRTFFLEGHGVTWRMAKSSSDALYAVGNAAVGLYLKRVPWSDEHVHAQTAIFTDCVSDAQEILFDVPDSRTKPILLHAVGTKPLPMRKLWPETAGAISAGSPAWATSSTLAMAYSDAGAMAWQIQHSFGKMIVCAYGANGDVLTTGTLRLQLIANQLAYVPVTFCTSVKPIRIGIGSLLCRPLFQDAQGNVAEEESIRDRPFAELESAIQSLHQFHGGGLNCVVALFDVGGAVIHEPIHGTVPLPFAEGIENPQGTFLADGRFVVAGHNEVRVYKIEEKQVKQVAQAQLDIPAVAITHQKNTISLFAVVSAKGRVQIYAAP